MSFKTNTGTGAVKVGRPPKQRIFYAVTYESHVLAPLTVTGEIQASNPARSAWLAVKDSRLRAKGIRWSSLVVLLDKVGPVGPPASKV